jgi:DNA-binding transcriptional ArsR family regulator
MKLFLNPANAAYLRSLAKDFGESTNAVRLELNKFEEAGMLYSETQGNKKLYKANEQHPLFKDINSLLLKYVGIDRIINNVIERLGEVAKVFLDGDYVAGKDSGVIDLVFIGNIDRKYLSRLTQKTEQAIQKKIRYLVYADKEWQDSQDTNLLLLWTKK